MDFNNDDKSVSNIAVLTPAEGTLLIQGEGALRLPSGTTNQRPLFQNGQIRYNSETGYVEVASGSQWVNIQDVGSGGLPAGGVQGNVLIKQSSTDYDTAFGPITADMAPYAKQLVAFVKNDTTGTLLKGTPVYQTGNAGNSWTVLVRPADASDPTKMPAIGVLAQDLATEETGDLIVLGEIRDVDTSAFNAGDLIYVAPGGGYTNVKPTGNDAIQFLGIVTKVHATNGGGYVTGTGTLDVFRKNPADGFEGWTGTGWTSLYGALNDLTDVTVSNVQNNQLLKYNGSQWVNTTLTTLSGYGITDAVLKTGDTMTGSLSLPSTKTEGLLVTGEYTWMDIIGDLTPKTGGAQAAQLQTYIGECKAWTHTSFSYGDLLYHIPHDYAPDTDLFFHVHWGHNGTNIAGSFIIKLWATYAKRTYPATTFITPVPLTITLSSINMTNSPRYCHRVDEILLSTPGGSANLLDTSAIEVDGVISIHYQIDTIPSITGSDVANLPYIHTMDIHMQSKNIGTLNKDPNYYGSV